MTIEELRAKLREVYNTNDAEQAHIDMDNLLIEYIGDDEVKNIYRDAVLWYA